MTQVVLTKLEILFLTFLFLFFFFNTPTLVDEISAVLTEALAVQKLLYLILFTTHLAGDMVQKNECASVHVCLLQVSCLENH